MGENGESGMAGSFNGHYAVAAPRRVEDEATTAGPGGGMDRERAIGLLQDSAAMVEYIDHLAGTFKDIGHLIVEVAGAYREQAAELSRLRAEAGEARRNASLFDRASRAPLLSRELPTDLATLVILGPYADRVELSAGRRDALAAKYADRIRFAESVDCPDLPVVRAAFGRAAGRFSLDALRVFAGRLQWAYGCDPAVRKEYIDRGDFDVVPRCVAQLAAQLARDAGKLSAPAVGGLYFGKTMSVIVAMLEGRDLQRIADRRYAVDIAEDAEWMKLAAGGVAV